MPARPDTPAAVAWKMCCSGCAARAREEATSAGTSLARRRRRCGCWAASRRTAISCRMPAAARRRAARGVRCARGAERAFRERVRAGRVAAAAGQRFGRCDPRGVMGVGSSGSHFASERCRVSQSNAPFYGLCLNTRARADHSRAQRAPQDFRKPRAPSGSLAPCRADPTPPRSSRPAPAPSHGAPRSAHRLAGPPRRALATARLIPIAPVPDRGCSGPTTRAWRRPPPRRPPAWRWSRAPRSRRRSS
jgi:hypothetical protein